jgi:uncharacterized iron-regulated membrane protein
MVAQLEMETARPDAPVRAVGRPRKKRSIWWRLHQWAGLQMSLYLAFVFITGTLAVMAHELDWMARPAMWAAPTAVEDRVSWGQVADAAQASRPDSSLWILYAPLHPAATFDVIMREPDGAMRHVYVHPRTGQVTGDGPWAGFQRFLRDAHRRLMIMQTIGPVRIGIVLVCLSSVFLAVSFISAFWVYKKWWRGFFRWPKGRDARALTGDVHRFIGIWSMWFVLVMTVTGLWYLAEEFGARPAAPQPPPLEALENAPAPSGDALDRGLAELAEAVPSYDVRHVIWPTERQPVFLVTGQTDRAILVENRANAARIALDGSLVDVFDPRTLSVHQRITAANNPVHFGTFGGYWTKALYFVFGAGLSALTLTGAAIYALRIAKAERRAARWTSGLLKTWRAMGLARWAALALTLLPLVLAPFIMG